MNGTLKERFATTGLRFARFLTALSLVAAFALPGGAALAAAPAAGADAGDSLEQIWAARSSELAAFLSEADQLREQAETLAGPLADSLQTMRARFIRLSGLYHASRGHPTEQFTTVQQMHGLRDSLARNTRPLRDIAETITQRLREIASLKQEFDNLQSAGSQDGIGGSAGSEGLRNYTQDLETTRRKLAQASARLERILAPAGAAAERFDGTISEIEAGLPKTWEEYYLTPSGNDVADLASAPSLLTEWARSFDARMGFAYPHTLSGWFSVLVAFSLSALVMAALGYLGLRGLRQLPARWRKAGEDVIKNAWVWMGVGFSVLMASGNRNGGIYFALVLCGALVLIAGIAAMSWRLRIAVHPELAKKPSPLKKLYVPAAIGVVMLFSDLPTRILGVMWGAVMLAFLVHMYRFTRKHPPKEELPLLERFSYRAAFAFGAASLLVAAGGYARLAILIYTLLFALANILTLGNALMTLFGIIAERRVNRENYPVFAAVAHAVAIPAAWLLSLVCTFPWLWAVPGANYLLRFVTSAHYSFGFASFDFTKMLVIVVLFFLFRSIIGMARAYLDHLPDRMPDLEKGVIPPLRTVVVYGLWALFILISLGLVGVNFTSIAVVAGGLSVGIGFGMQNLFNNLVSGIMLIFGRTILVGDVVDVPGASGTVEAITIRSTVIRTADRAQVFVPNSAIMSGQFTNWTRNGRMVRRTVDVGVAYGSDTVLVQRLLLDIAAGQEHVRKTPPPSVAFTNFGGSSLDFTLYVFVDNVDNGLAVQSAIRHSINRVFTENGIEIPFPQVDVHMRDDMGTEV